MKRNIVLGIVCSVFLIGVGVSFAYYVAKINSKGSGASTVGSSVSISNSTITTSENASIKIDGTDVLPGHKEIAEVILTAEGDNEVLPYSLVWKGNNTLHDDLKATVYKTDATKDVSISCTDNKTVVDGVIKYNEICTENGFSALGTAIASDIVIAQGSDLEATLSNDFITSSSSGTTVYYYVVIEYPNNTTSSQTNGGSLTGKIIAQARSYVEE